jgi:hypothetical protein
MCLHSSIHAALALACHRTEHATHDNLQLLRNEGEDALIQRPHDRVKIGYPCHGSVVILGEVVLAKSHSLRDVDQPRALARAQDVVDVLGVCNSCDRADEMR